jgi:hypothetical protein
VFISSKINLPSDFKKCFSVVRVLCSDVVVLSCCTVGTGEKKKKKKTKKKKEIVSDVIRSVYFNDY